MPDAPCIFLSRPVISKESVLTIGKCKGEIRMIYSLDMTDEKQF